MYSPGKGVSSSDKNLPTAKAHLNPNATEFVPSALRSPSAGITGPGASSKFATFPPPTPEKSILDRLESSNSINSDDDSQQYWRHQLPDDITPDFKVMGLDDNTQGINTLPFSSLSLTDIHEGSRYSTSSGLSSLPVNGDNHSSYGEFQSPSGFHTKLGKPWDPQIVSNDQILGREGHDSGNSGYGFLGDVPNEQLLVDNSDVNPLEFLASQFPGFAAESVAEVYFANAGDLNLTIEMLTQLELQIEGGLNQSQNSKTLSAPNLAMDFPALSASDGQTDLSKSGGDGLHQNGSSYRSSEKQGAVLFRSNSFIPSKGATDFASAVRKMASQDSGIWKYERNGSSDASIGSSRSSQGLVSSYNSGHSRGVYGNRVQSRGSAHASPVWLDTGTAVGNCTF
ncbi:hypothetical protein OROGR_014582 [Orobanche gracilis]